MVETRKMERDKSRRRQREREREREGERECFGKVSRGVTPEKHEDSGEVVLC